MKHRLLVAVDGSKTSGRTISYVAGACAGMKEAEHRIVLFHVLPAMPPWLEAGEAARLEPERDHYQATAIASAERMLGEMKKQLVQAGVPAACVRTEWSDESQNVAGAILDAARQLKCNTIVLGRRGGSMIGQFLAGGVAERVARKRSGFAVWLVE
jgi:nucleotide-binding universal stress UspA family protein